MWFVVNETKGGEYANGLLIWFDAKNKPGRMVGLVTTIGESWQIIEFWNGYAPFEPIWCRIDAELIHFGQTQTVWYYSSLRKQSQPQFYIHSENT